MSEAQKRIGFAGLSAKGSWASTSHKHYLTTTPLYKITALLNSTKASAQAAASKYSLGTVSIHETATSLAADKNVDIVAICVNVPQHYQIVKPALEAGKDVFCEWPLARNHAEAKELNELAKSKGVRTLVGFQARQDPAILKAKQMVESGKLGKILGTTMYGHGAMLGPVLTEYFLHMLPVEAGANMLTIPFGHAIDALCFVLGEVDSLSATISNHRPEHSYVDEQGKEKRKVTKTSPDYVSFTGTLVGGANVDVTYAEGMSRTGRDFYWEINGTDGSIILEGGKEPLVWGHMQMNQPTLKFVDSEPGAKLGVVKVEKAGDFDKYDYSYNVGKAWDAWAGVGEEVHTVATFEDAVIRHSMIDAIYRSAAKGTRERYL